MVEQAIAESLRDETVEEPRPNKRVKLNEDAHTNQINTIDKVILQENSDFYIVEYKQRPKYSVIDSIENNPKVDTGDEKVPGFRFHSGYYSSYETMQEDLNRHIEKLPSFGLQCKFCPKISGMTCHALDHVETHFRKFGRYSFSCKKCEKSVATKSAVRAHRLKCSKRF